MSDKMAEKSPQTLGKGEERYLLVELSCKDHKCSPCTYPNCQRFVREVPKKAPYATRMTKMFEIKKPVTSPQDPLERLVLIELSCKDKKCSPCTYPNCQRFAKVAAGQDKKKPFKVKVTEIERGEDVESLLSK